MANAEMTKAQVVAQEHREAIEAMTPEEIAAVTQPINGDSKDKHLLSMEQFSPEDIYRYIREAHIAHQIIKDPRRRGINLLDFLEMKIVMRQPSTRTGGSMRTAMIKLGGAADYIGGMESSAEAKEEVLYQSWEAFATQGDIIGTRTHEEYGPAFAAHTIEPLYEKGDIDFPVSVINLGDGKNEHLTQALGDLFAMSKEFGLDFKDMTLAVVGDHAGYRAFHSLLIAAAKLGINVIAVQIDEAPVPQYISDMFEEGKITFTNDMDAALEVADALYMGRRPKEYTDKNNPEALHISNLLMLAYEGWVLDYKRLQKMQKHSKVYHPRPINTEIDISAFMDIHRMRDVRQMADMIPMRMATIAEVLGKRISDHVELAA